MQRTPSTPNYLFIHCLIEVVDLQGYISFRCTTQRFNIFLDYTPFKVILAVFPVLYITSLHLIYFIPSSLYLFISFPYLAPPLTPPPFHY